jgi:hypothetical protein
MAHPGLGSGMKLARLYFIQRGTVSIRMREGDDEKELMKLQQGQHDMCSFWWLLMAGGLKSST